MTANAVDNVNFSQRLMRKGVLVEETYRCFAAWDLTRSFRENIMDLRKSNPIGAANSAWLREVTSTISSRFASGDPIEPLVMLAKGGLSLETWKYCYLWHIGSTDGLLLAFLRDFLYPRTRGGIALFTTEDVIPWVLEKEDSASLSDYGLKRMGRDFLRAAAAFGFLQGSARREIRHPVIPENAILYAIYSLWEKQQSVERLVSSERWRMFLMSQADVEHELLNLHQFRRLQYARAGSAAELHLTYPSLADFITSIIS